MLTKLTKAKRLHNKWAVSEEALPLLEKSEKYSKFLIESDVIEIPKEGTEPFLLWIDTLKEEIGKEFAESVVTIQDYSEQNSNAWLTLRSQFFTSSTHWIGNEGTATPTENKKCIQLGVQRCMHDLGKSDPLVIANEATQKSFYETQMMARGHIMEDEAITLYQAQTGFSIQQVGFAHVENTLIGDSVDFLENDDCVGEIKAPDLVGFLDPDYYKQHYAQCQIHMLVHKRKMCKYLKYFPHLPLNIMEIPIDYTFMYNLKHSINRVTPKVDKAYMNIMNSYYT